jgi:hypothetical protein
MNSAFFTRIFCISASICQCSPPQLSQRHNPRKVTPCILMRASCRVGRTPRTKAQPLDTCSQHSHFLLEPVVQHLLRSLPSYSFFQAYSTADLSYYFQYGYYKTCGGGN